ncbi:MAG: hypothetical protein HY927_14120 [Elusimicrobia bacterium]|nr:hypothetical protein [Elusimicrobiota bacterium]
MTPPLPANALPDGGWDARPPAWTANPSPRSVHRTLLRTYGPRGWWPVTPAGSGVPAYRPGTWGRLSARQRLEVCLGTLLTQNTAWDNASRAVEGLNRRGLMSLGNLGRAPLGALQRAIRCSGYFRQKALKIKAFVRHARRRGDLGRWLAGPLDGLREELLGIHGVGPETADSMLLYAGFRPAFVVDAYTLRIGSRLGWFAPGAGYETARRLLMRSLPVSPKLYGEFHALLVELAKRHCRKTPVCPGCPLLKECGHGQGRGGGPVEGRTIRRGVLALWAGAMLLAPPSWSAAPSGKTLAAAGKVDITPVIGHHRVYLAGFGAKGRKAAGVHDPLYARILVLSDGKKTVAIVGLDLLGLFRNDVLDLRRLTRFQGEGRFLFVAATHHHAGPDTLGLWGPVPGASGVDRGYLRKVKEEVAAKVLELADRLEPARLRGAVRRVDPRGLCKDIRDPAVIDEDLGVLRFETPQGRPIATVVNWSCHPEVLGASNRLVTADYPGPLCGRVEERTGGACVFLAGSLGGLLTPDTKAGAGDFYEAHRIGTKLADLALDAPTGAGADFPLDFRMETVNVPVENSRYLLFLPTLVAGHELNDGAGKPLPGGRAFTLAGLHALRGLKTAELPWIDTEVSLLRIGPAAILGIPGEIFPELVVGGFQGQRTGGRSLTDPSNPDPPDLGKAPKGPYLKESMPGRLKLVAGLAGDEIGYIVPEYDFKVRRSLTLSPRLPGHHYEETNSLGKSATGIVLEAARRLFK